MTTASSAVASTPTTAPPGGRISSALGHQSGRWISVTRSRMKVRGVGMLYMRRALPPRNLAWRSADSPQPRMVSSARQTSSPSWW